MYIVTEMWIWKGKGASIKDVPVQGLPQWVHREEVKVNKDILKTSLTHSLPAFSLNPCMQFSMRYLVPGGQCVN